MANANQWLRESLFNLLVDYYPEIQFRPYGAGATRENVLPALKGLDLGYVCIYAKGHSGYTTWPSSLKTQHNMLAKDMPRFFREVSREAGTRLVLYYSGLLDGIAGLRHPQWRMKTRDGADQEYFTDFKVLFSYALCPLSEYWDRWVSIQLGELVEGYDPDGIWVDGDWPGPCYCHRCQDRFRQESGWKDPWVEVLKRPGFDAAYATIWNRITHEWRVRFSRYVKKLKPGCVYSAGNVNLRREFLEPFDWRSGDFFSPGFFHLHDMARTARWYSTMGMPYDAYVCDTSFTHARKHVRSRSKTLPRMMQEAATIAANGGAVGYWTYPTGAGALAPSRMKKALAVRRFIEDRAELFRQSEPVQWTAILATVPDTTVNGGVQGAHKALAALHRSPIITDEAGIAQATRCGMIVLPEQWHIDDKTVGRLAAFVRRGGKLLTSGSSIQSAALRKLLGVRGVQPAAVTDGHIILNSHDEPTGIASPWDKLELAGAEELYPLYLSWDQFNPEARNMPNNWPMHGQIDEENPEPAGMPAAIIRHLGKGVAIHITTDIFEQYRVLGDPQMLRWLREIIDRLDERSMLKTNAPSWVDASLRVKSDRLLIHLVNQNPGRELGKLHTDDLWADEVPAVGPFRFEVRCPIRPRRVTWEPGGAKLDYTFANGVLRVTAPRLEIHGCIAIAPWRAGDRR